MIFHRATARNTTLAAAGLFCVLLFSADALAQYSGAPVKVDRLIKALRSRQLQSSDIVAVIRSNGVTFTLTPDVKKALIAAGARPEVIAAVANNKRGGAIKGSVFARTDKKRTSPAYTDLLEKALSASETRNGAAGAVRYLQTAIKMDPAEPKAYQMMGFINLYKLGDLEAARQYMRESIANGGSVVFRVYHDDSGNFTGRCSGSLYVSPDTIRFESDDNTHTFETSTANIESVKADTESSKIWKKHPVFNVRLRFGKEKAKFRFAPISGRQVESNMATHFIYELQPDPGKVPAGN